MATAKKPRQSPFFVLLDAARRSKESPGPLDRGAKIIALHPNKLIWLCGRAAVSARRQSFLFVEDLR